MDIKTVQGRAIFTRRLAMPEIWVSFKMNLRRQKKPTAMHMARAVRLVVKAWSRLAMRYLLFLVLCRGSIAVFVVKVIFADYRREV